MLGDLTKRVGEECSKNTIHLLKQLRMWVWVICVSWTEFVRLLFPLALFRLYGAIFVYFRFYKEKNSCFVYYWPLYDFPMIPIFVKLKKHYIENVFTSRFRKDD